MGIGQARYILALTVDVLFTHSCFSIVFAFSIQSYSIYKESSTQELLIGKSCIVITKAYRPVESVSISVGIRIADIYLIYDSFTCLLLKSLLIYLSIDIEEDVQHVQQRFRHFD